MSWKIAEAKQHFSDVVRQAAEEPQLIFNRDRPVAAVIAAIELEAFLLWRAGYKVRPLAAALAEASQICGEEAYTLDPPRRADRPNPLVRGGTRAPGRHQRRK